MNIFLKKILNIVKNKYFKLFFAGVISSLSFAPTYYFILLYFSLPKLFAFLANTKNQKQRALAGFFFGLGHFFISFYWISASLFIDISSYWYLLPFSLFLLPIFFSFVFIVPQSLLFTLYSHKADHKKIIIFSCIWVVFEIFRSYLFYGFPWNLIGYSLINNSYLLQIASYFGPYGMSLLVMISSLLPFLYVQKQISIVKLILLELFLIIPFIIIGYLIINYSALDNSPSLNVRIVQANILQQQRWKNFYQEKTFRKYIDLTLKNSNLRPDIIIWPESANDFILNDFRGMKFLGDILQPNQLLITGIDRLSKENNKLILNNSLIVVNKEGEIVDFYDKMKLVPFGEFIPFKQYLPISKLTTGLIDYSPGKNLKILGFGKDNSKKFIPFICFEAIFPNNANIFTKKFDFLVNITNDSWFGVSSGPYQHFAMTQVRAVEAGVPLIRVAVTGISGLIDSFGEIVLKTEINEEISLDFKIPQKKYTKNIYVVYGDLLIVIIMMMLLLYGTLDYSSIIKWSRAILLKK